MEVEVADSVEVEDWVEETADAVETAGATLLLEDAPAFISLLEEPDIVYVRRELIRQNVSWKADGLLPTKSVQLSAFGEHVESELHTLPAQSPQKVMSNTICWFANVLP